MATDKRILRNTEKYRRTRKGLITNLFQKIKSRNTVEFDIKYLHDFSNCKKFNRLFDEWVKSNYDKRLKPSLDRISHKKGYTKSNIQWLSWEENRFKQTIERRVRKGKVIQLLDGSEIKTFASQRQAVLKTGLSQGNISMVLNGKRNTCGGFEWKYKETKTVKA